MDSGAVRAVPWRLAVRLTERDGAPWTALDACLLRPRGQQPVLVGTPEPVEGTPSAAGLLVARLAGRARRMLRPWARAGVRLLPPRLRRPVKALAHRLARGHA